ncbi:class I SAM-dependent methyltransferase [Aurantiacibacter poecillastricola]|uniref:class I SAM-dependent methyltransferase n=1 Tax=Aurantiacibacter poecillastricola TaxID=3064385 RepID=UPI00273E2623|nr:class I SAM-dependent methyltransferase [Aurantiacibacter sp. 219JJ12-13]MDP5262418.1 methyltransferase domain-containing protein [Aurantiacibacter sp. 219JJ12-13]
MLDTVTAKQADASTMDVCRACKAPDPYVFLAYGSHSPAQMLIREEDLGKEQPSFPLNAQACLECGLIAVADQIPADFFRHYLYIPSGAATMHSHFDELASVLVERAGDDGLIVDIGSNDGLMLAQCNARGATTLGFDPAANIAALAAEKGVETHVDYFHPQSAAEVKAKHGPAKVISTTNTFNHIGDLHNFMEAVCILLADDGTFVIEVPRAKEMLEKAEFDNMYHEHVSEFSLLSVVKLAEFFDLEVTDAKRLPKIHGGSMRVFITRKSAGFPAQAVVQEMLAEERAGGMLDQETYDRQVEAFDETGERLRAMLDDLKAQGKTIAGYGASARGNTLITYFGVDGKYLDYLVDKNPLKHGLYSPNTRIPVKPVEAIAEEKPDVLFLLAWNFFDEIYEQQAEHRARGGKFLVPLPTPRLVD